MPSALHDRPVLALARVFTMVVVGAVLVSASFTRAAEASTLRDRADVIMNKSYVDFQKAKKARPVPFNWSDDGCSGWKIRELYRRVFDGPCQQHDFGYRNYGKGLQLGANDGTRLWIDKRFLREMRRLCDNRWPSTRARNIAGRASCKKVALDVMYRGVRTFAKSAFYGETPQLPGQSDPRQWRISAAGLGPIKLGMTAREARAVGVTVRVERSDYCDSWTVPGLDGVWMLAPHSSNSTLRSVGFNDRNGHGALTVENGDSLDDLKARAGSRLRFHSKNESLGRAFYRIYSAGRHTALEFSVDSSTREVISQEVGYPGEFYYTDGIEMCG